MRWAGRAARMVANRTKCKVFMWKTEGKCSLGRPRRRWEGNVTTDRTAVELDGVEWIHLPEREHNWQGLVCTVTDPVRKKERGKYLDLCSMETLRIWKETVVSCFKILSKHSSGEIREMAKRWSRL